MQSKIFSCNNKKLQECSEVYGLRLVAFDLPAGYTCPAATLCHSRANKETGKVEDFGQFRCYAASTEAIYKNVRIAHWRNFDLSKTEDFVNVICAEIKRLKLTSIRIHASGDFYHVKYAQKWIQIARLNPDVTFWGYTKMLPFIKMLNAEPNMKFTYSIGGSQDSKVTSDIPTNTVVTDDYQISNDGSTWINHNGDVLPLACEAGRKADDYEYIMSGESFGIRLHGTQSKKS